MTHICSKCGKECKDKRGLSNHENKCGIIHNKTCSFCQCEFSTVDNLNRHYLTCKVMKQQQEEEKRQQEEKKKQEEEEHKYKLRLEQETNILMYSITEYKGEIEKIKLKAIEEEKRHENMMIMIKEEQRSIFNEKETLKDQLKEKNQLIQSLNHKIHQLEKKNDMLNSNMIEFAKKATDKVTTIYNGPTIQNTLQLQHFDASALRDKIEPPSRMVYSTSNLMDHLHKFGLGNFYRSLDRSRGVIMWIDKDGKEIRDSNCSQLCKEILFAMEGDIRLQLAYQRKRLDELEAIHGDSYTDKMVTLSENISFCNRLLNRDESLMKEIQKELSKRAKNKNDTSVDTPRLVGYTKFMSGLENVLFPEILEWMSLPFPQFGKWLGKALHSILKVEGGSFNKEKPFVLIQNDEGSNRMVYSNEFYHYIKDAYQKIVNPQVQLILDHLLKDHQYVQMEHVLKLKSWIEAGSPEDNRMILNHVIQTYR